MIHVERVCVLYAIVYRCASKTEIQRIYTISLYQFELLYSDISRDIACFLLIDIDMYTNIYIQ